MNKIYSWLYGLYVSFRRFVGWARVREIWICDVPNEDAMEFHVSSEESSHVSFKDQDEYDDLFNLQGYINWSNCWMERVKYIGRLGDWSPNPDIFPGLLYHMTVNLDLDHTPPDQCFYIPQFVLDKSLVDETHDIHLYHEPINDIPTLCIIHYYHHEYEARFDLKYRIDKLTGTIGPMDSRLDPTKQFQGGLS